MFWKKKSKAPPAPPLPPQPEQEEKSQSSTSKRPEPPTFESLDRPVQKQKSPVRQTQKTPKQATQSSRPQPSPTGGHTVDQPAPLGVEAPAAQESVPDTIPGLDVPEQPQRSQVSQGPHFIRRSAFKALTQDVHEAEIGTQQAKRLVEEVQQLKDHFDSSYLEFHNQLEDMERKLSFMDTTLFG